LICFITYLNLFDASSEGKTIKARLDPDRQNSERDLRIQNAIDPIDAGVETGGLIAMIERRASARHKTFIKGRILFNNRLSSMDCIVRDISDTGSRLEFSENVVLPDAFELYIPHKDGHFQAQVRWRKGDNIGVSWRPDYALAPATEQGRPEHSVIDSGAKLELEVALLRKRLDALLS
jgi:hypothetical protein